MAEKMQGLRWCSHMGSLWPPKGQGPAPPRACAQSCVLHGSCLWIQHGLDLV